MSDEYYKKIFSENLKYYMRKKGVAQIDIVIDLNFDKSAVSTWVNGTRLPRMDKVDALAKYFGVKRSDLIEEHSPEPAAPVLSDVEKRIIEAYRNADPVTQANILKLLDVKGDTGSDVAGRSAV